MSRLFLSLMLSLGIASSASAVTMDWVPIGDPGNPADTEVMTCCFASVGTSGYGSVSYNYYISKYETTNAQYTEFLNAVAATDPGNLYYPFGTDIDRTGSPGSYHYTASPARANMPVVDISPYDAMRFANWLHNGQPTGPQNASTTESGAYTFTAQGILNNSIVRNSNAQIFLPSENEWYKAAYYNALSASYFDYPSGSDTQTICATPTALANRANCNFAVPNDLTIVGSYPGSASPYGTFDQGGNASEFTETIVGFNRKTRGGNFYNPADNMSAAFSPSVDPSVDWITGFRVAMIPEPSTGLLVIAGLIGIAVRRRLNQSMHAPIAFASSLMIANAATAATLTVEPDKLVYNTGETITLTVFGDDKGAGGYTIFGRLDYSGALVDNVSRTQTTLLLVAPTVTVPWIPLTLEAGDDGVAAFSDAFYQLTQGGVVMGATNLPGTLSTVTLIAQAVGVVDVKWHRGLDPYTLVFFDLGFDGIAPGTSFTIVPEPSTARLVIAGLLGLAGGRRSRA